MSQLYVTQTPQGIESVFGGILSATPPQSGASSTMPPPAWIPALSTNVGLKVFTVQDLIEKAWRKCKLLPEKLTREWRETANQSLLLLLTDRANEGIPLWKVARVIIPMNIGQESIQCPVGTVAMLNLNYRRYTDWALSSALTSSAGGNVANLVDRLAGTTFLQTSANGTIQMDAGAGNSVSISMVGFMSFQNQYYQLVLEGSPDGATWFNVVSLPQMLYPDSQFVWFDIDGAPAYEFWRLREVGGNTLTMRQLALGASPAAVPLGVENRDTFASLPNRTFQAEVPAIYYFDKQHQPIVHVWPTTNSLVMHLEAWVEMQIDDLGDPSQVLDTPQRWYNALAWDLAADIASEHPEVDDNREAKIVKRRDMAVLKAWSHENDFGPVRISPDISAYTR